MSEDDKKKDEKKGMIPKCKKAMKLKAKAKPGRGRAEPQDVIDAITDADGWTSFKAQIGAQDEETINELKEFFNNEDATGIGNDGIGDALFGEDEADDLKGIWGTLKGTEPAKLVDHMYDTGLIDEETFNDGN